MGNTAASYALTSCSQSAAQSTIALMIKNSGINLLGGILPGLVALGCTPLILLRHGTGFFAAYSIQTALLMTVGLMDFGISRGITLATYDHLLNPSGEPSLPFKAGLRFSLIVSVCVALLCLPCALIYFAFSAHDQDLVISTLLQIASGSLTMVTLPFRALLEIRDRFGRLNVIRSLLACTVPVAPLLPAVSNVPLSAAACYVLAGRVIGLIAYYRAGGISLGQLRRIRKPEPAWLRAFAKRCGWAGLANTGSLVLTYADRFLLGALAAPSQVAIYAVANEVATKIWMATGAVQSASTPRIAVELHASESSGSGQRLRSVSYAKAVLTFTVVLPSMLLVVFCDPIFKVWLRSAYLPETSQAAKILIAGMALNSMSQLNFSLLQLHRGEAFGARLQVANLFAAILLMLAFIPSLGAVGAAIAFSVRLAMDAVLTRYLTQRQSESAAGFTYPEIAMAAATFAAVFYFNG